MSLNLVLIDTSAWIRALGKVNIPLIKERINHLLREDMAAITPLIYLELVGGTDSEAEFNDLKNLRALCFFMLTIILI